jgi:hypothetical protein
VTLKAGAEIVEDDHFIAAADKFVNHVAAYEACASGNQDLHGGTVPGSSLAGELLTTAFHGYDRGSQFHTWLAGPAFRMICRHPSPRHSGGSRNPVS